ncbi:hypothetical protein [Thalassobellus sediminis]|uniref:hypothetical protein n=1 Tax=Thalassobellus sediminis TaxID=3367753 RepID=UPI0037A087DB
MKKIFYLYTVLLGTIIVGCNPLEDIYDDANANNPGVVEEVELTLSDDDYDELDLSFGSFSSEDDAKSMLPDYLSKLYPYLSNGSSVTVDFRLYIGNAFWLRDYSLKQEDYALSGSDLLGFQSDATPEDYIADILSNNYSSPKEGDYVAASYFQFTGSAYTVTPTVSLEENFDYGAAAGDLTTISGGSWTNHSGASNQLMFATTSLSMADYPSTNLGGALAISSSGSEDVNTSLTSIISTGTVYASALINLSEVGDGTYFFHLMEEDGSFSYSARVGAKSDGSGNILFGIGASSSSLSYGATPFDLNTTYLIVSTYDTATGTSNLYVLTAPEATEPTTPEATNTGVAGNTANRIGIRQGGGGPTALIDGIRVANTWSAIMTNDVLEDEIVGNKTSNKVIYTFTEDVWEIATDGVYLVNDEDFASMGIETFGSSTQPDNYLPTFLNIKFPYALEGEALNVIYGYVSSSSGAQTRGNLYTKIEGEWVAYESTIDSKLQFGLESGVWVPDNTIRYTFTSDDYTLVGETLLNVSGFENAAGNLSNFGNFNRTGGNSGWTDDQMITGIGVVLDSLDPSAAEGQKYIVSVDIYNGSSGVENFSLIKTGGEWVVNE